jgi:hypothetical protein
MKNPLIIVLILLVLLGSCLFLIANCGGREIVQTTDNNTVKGWQVVGTPGFSSGEARNIKLVINRGVPYVAYFDMINGEHVTAMKFDGASWETVGPPGFSDTDGSSLGFCFYNDIPYIAYDAYYSVITNKQSNNRGQVMKFNGVTWENQSNNGIVDAAIYYMAFTIANGTPYFAYSKIGFQLSVLIFDGTNWTVVGKQNFSESFINGLSMTSYNGIPYVIYADAAHPSTIVGGPIGIATVMKFNGSTWETVGMPGFSTGNVTSTNIFIDNDTIYTAFNESGFPAVIGTDLVSKASVMKFNGVSWEYVGKPGFSADEVNSTSLFVYNGVPYVAFKDRSVPYGLDKVSVMKFDGSNWGYIGPQGFTGTNTGENNISLFIYNGIPYIAYRDDDNGKKVTVMKYVE